MSAVKHILKFLSLALLAVTSACEPAPDDLFARRFLIRSGDHYSTPRLAETLQSDRLIFHATFDQSAVYDFGDAALQTNKNKLLGFADCNSLHHENSARFAWQWFNDRLEIYAYCYVNSERVEEFAGVVNLDEKNLYEIRLTDAEYIFYINGKQTNAIGRASVCDKGIYYMLYPYFGGSLAAPHDVTITLSIER
jgi:hypothetical protein